MRYCAWFRLDVIKGLTLPRVCVLPLSVSVSTALNGKEHNFATSSASASEAFEARERCTGYTGEGETFPTGVSLDLHQCCSPNSCPIRERRTRRDGCSFASNNVRKGEDHE